MNKEERSLLLYFESCAADHEGRVEAARMNGEDREIARRWNESGFVKFGRICASDMTPTRKHWCELSEEAWKKAHEERRARYDRMYAKRNWKKTEELRGEAP